ncbi:MULTISPECIES: helix-turn-helix domain-containing protein [Bradyrhizobium]|uniref:helix-turn-helix transcriptional regulator n=2 Tax=Nitrobacteraceae TaxID=41294 RepID=UPI0004839705
MLQKIESAGWPMAAGLAASRRQSGVSVLHPIDAHRIVVHLSPSTRTFCRETGYAALRGIGHIDLIPSGATGGFDAETPYESLEVLLSPAVLDRAAAETGHRGGAFKFEMRHMLRNERIVHLAQAVETELLSDSPGEILYADSIGTALAIQLMGMTTLEPAQAGRLSALQLKRVTTYIDGHLDHPLTLEVLSREAGVSSSHLRAWFKAATGLTVHRYVLRRRVERARFLLLHHNLRPSEVALEVGFAHQSHLSRWMRRELGCTPSSFRKRA